MTYYILCKDGMRQILWLCPDLGAGFQHQDKCNHKTLLLLTSINSLCRGNFFSQPNVWVNDHWLHDKGWDLGGGI